MDQEVHQGIISTFKYLFYLLHTQSPLERNVMNLLLPLKRTHFHVNNTFRDCLPLSFTSFRWCWQLSLKNRSLSSLFEAASPAARTTSITCSCITKHFTHPPRHQLSHTWKIISSLPFSVSSLITSDCKSCRLFAACTHSPRRIPQVWWIVIITLSVC